MTKFLYFTDIHLGRFDKIVEDGDKKILKEVKNKIYKMAIEKNIKNIVFGGDISDRSKLSRETIIALMNLFINVEKYDIKTHIILGNHDIENNQENCLITLKNLINKKKLLNLFIYDEPTHKKIDGINFNFLPFPYGLEDKKNSEPSVCFIHRDWKGSITDNGKKELTNAYYPNKKVNFKNDLIISGHLHKKQILKSNVIYPGSFIQTKFGEDPEKFFLEMSVSCKDNKIVWKEKFHKNKSFLKFVTKQINCEEDIEEIENNKNVLYKVIIDKEVARKLENSPKIYNLDNILVTTSKKNKEKDHKASVSIEESNKVLLNETNYVNYLVSKGKDLKFANKCFEHLMEIKRELNSEE